MNRLSLFKWLSASLRLVSGTTDCCRFFPSCSHYADEALQRFGWFKGSFLAMKRLLKCSPWSAGGYDPVPSEKKLEKKLFEKKLLMMRSF